jgi:hypothetical protein
VFASKGVAEHLARGAIGIGAFAACVYFAASHPWLAIVLVPVALVALRGCPMCWTVGLAQTLAARARGEPADGACVDGTCSARPAAPPER